MSEETKPGVFRTTEPSTLTYSHLFAAQAFKGKGGKETGDPKFDATFELASTHAELDSLKREAVVVAKAKWPDRNFGAEIAAGTFKMPWVAGDKLADKAAANGKNREFSRGKVVLTARTGVDYPPQLAVLESGRFVDLPAEPTKAQTAAFYPGVQVLFRVRFTAYPGVGANPDGVNAYLERVVSGNRGERLKIGGQSAAEEFSGYAGSFSDEDLTGDLKDEISF